MTVAITGLTFTKNADAHTPDAYYACFVGYGTYTAADFTITAADGLGFTPKKVLVSNLTDRNEILSYINSGLGTSNVEGLMTVAAGTRTYEAHGLTVATNSLTVDVTVAGPITDNDDFVIECWG